MIGIMIAITIVMMTGMMVDRITMSPMGHHHHDDDDERMISVMLPSQNSLAGINLID